MNGPRSRFRRFQLSLRGLLLLVLVLAAFFSWLGENVRTYHREQRAMAAIASMGPREAKGPTPDDTKFAAQQPAGLTAEEAEELARQLVLKFQTDQASVKPTRSTIAANMIQIFS